MVFSYVSTFQTWLSDPPQQTILDQGPYPNSPNLGVFRPATVRLRTPLKQSVTDDRAEVPPALVDGSAVRVADAVHVVSARVSFAQVQGRLSGDPDLSRSAGGGPRWPCPRPPAPDLESV